MTKNILLTVCFLLILVIGITDVSGVNDLSFDADTQIYLSGPGLYLTVKSGSIVDSMTVYPNYASFDLSSSSTLNITSRDRKNLNNSLVSTSCGSSESSISIGPLGYSLLGFTVAPGGTCVTSGGSPIIPSPEPSPVPSTTPTTTPTTTPDTTQMPITETGEVIATNEAGGKTSVTTTEQTKAEVEVPSQAVRSDTSINIAPVAKTETAVSSIITAIPSSQSLVGGYVYNYTATVETTTIDNFLKPITITITYTDEQTADLDEDTLTINYYDETKSEWIALNTRIDKDNNTLTVTVDHFTYFAILGKPKIESITPRIEPVMPTTTRTTTRITPESSPLTVAELQARVQELIIKINRLKAQLAALQKKAPSTSYQFTTNLKYGMSSEGVKNLQSCLKNYPEIYPEGIVSGWFGPLTKAAVIRFQEKYFNDILKPWGFTNGTGFVGKTTRAKLNQICN